LQAMLLLWSWHALAMLVSCSLPCHMLAMLVVSHDIAVWLPCSGHVIATILP
jgi:hypothetical protein